MEWRKAPVLLVILALLSGTPSQAARVVRSFVGEDIPARLQTETPFIFSRTDSLYLNGRLLEAGESYEFRQGEGLFDLSALSAGKTDTLVIGYDPVPAWMVRSYGRDLPEVTDARQRPEIRPLDVGARSMRLADSDIRLSGAKSFRFSARSAGGSEFGQSLDLNISGELSPGLALTGSVSDRGYDPTYGTANSRLNELDKINLSLTSNRVHAQVGDIAIERSAGRGVPGKSVSGASFELDFPNWRVDAAAARPRGVFASTEFMGQDGFQGPYRIDNSGSARPIVPGSETVWLDGIRMEQGANKDYTIDYPTGRITFTVNRPIDSRTRIEIDFEPLATDYKEELFSAGGGAHSNDSMLYFGVEALREGDDRTQPLIGELSDLEKERLALAGDSAAYRSGVTVDSVGSYTLVVDSLPDSVYHYVGPGNGDYTVRFSYVGAGGDYRFVGSERYDFVGEGRGDYAPVVKIPAATRNDYYAAVVGSYTKLLGLVQIDVRATSWDQNLWSSRDDTDNDAMYYEMQASRRWRWQGRENSYRVSRRVKEIGFRNRQRLNRSDFRRRFLFPNGFLAGTDERLHEAAATVSPLAPLSLTGAFGLLEYDGSFDSRAGEIGAEYAFSERGSLKAAWQGISAHLDSAVLSGDGQADNLSFGARYRLWPSLWLSGRLERDSRQHEYTDLERGTRYDRVEVTAVSGALSDPGGTDRANGGTERMSWEYYIEDSLTSGWEEVLRRNRLSGSSSRRIGDLSYNATLSYQWLERPQGDENSFLGRADLRYNSSRRRLTVNTAYTISEERRNARGITYLEVEPGLGNFVKESGVFVPDPDGNYIEVEEILSDAARVRRAQKSFYLSKRWSFWQVRFDSEIEEELKDEGERTIWWALPFYSDPEQPYLFFSRRYNGVVRILPVRGFYAINLLLTENRENREISGSPRRREDITGRLSLKQAVSESYLEESLELFRYDRDAYFTGSGDVEGYEVALGVRQVIGKGEVSGRGAFRRARSEADERSDIYAVTGGSRVKVLGRGELRSELELYRQVFTNVSGDPSYQLTGNRPGTRGAVWSASLNYGVKGGVRMNFSITGRHSNDRTGRVTGRGEVVAAF